MNRFLQKKQRIHRMKGPVLMLLSSLGVLAFFFVTFSEIGSQAKEKETENLRHALEQSVTICYALEGAYPESLDYLKEHYGISWDEQRYLVDFETVGSNLPPDITIIDRR